MDGVKKENLSKGYKGYELVIDKTKTILGLTIPIIFLIAITMNLDPPVKFGLHEIIFLTLVIPTFCTYTYSWLMLPRFCCMACDKCYKKKQQAKLCCKDKKVWKEGSG